MQRMIKASLALLLCIVYCKMNAQTTILINGVATNVVLEGDEVKKVVKPILSPINNHDISPSKEKDFIHIELRLAPQPSQTKWIDNPRLAFKKPKNRRELCKATGEE